ncbi:MAG: Gfo/Idh/MocA family oxidoreductase [Acidobacteria bacterium]|nr:Gfo/Idh/MocA family oxidoreductase [Acidobacteriota bacterium]
MKVGIIGASFAQAAYLPALRHVPGAEVVAVASARLSSAQKAASAFGVPHAYDDWQRMLAAHTFDLVCIATPTVQHAPQTLAAIAAGAHVLCEKPTAMHAGEAARMLAAAEAAGRVHMIDHELRFNPNRARVQALIADGSLGEVRHVIITNIGPSWNDPASRPKGDWWSLADQGGGRLGANGSHQVDLLRWWLGEVAWITGAAPVMVPSRLDKATGEAWTATADDVAYFTAEMASGAVAQVFMSGVAAHNMNNVTQVFGSKGTVKLSNEDERLWFAKAGQGFEDITEVDPNAALPGVNPGIWNVSVVALMQELAAAIREGRRPARGATVVDGVANQRLLDAVRLSGTERRWVRPEDIDATA